MRNEISNHDDIIDSRDVIARIAELEAELEAAYEEYCDGTKEAGGEPLTQNQWMEMEDFWDDTELTALQSLQEEAEGYAPDWCYGAQLIRDSYFVEAMEELCKDIGDLPREIPAYMVIDWEATAENLKTDYTSVEFDGITYWVR